MNKTANIRIFKGDGDSSELVPVKVAYRFVVFGYQFFAHRGHKDGKMFGVTEYSTGMKVTIYLRPTMREAIAIAKQRLLEQGRENAEKAITSKLRSHDFANEGSLYGV